ncbi:ABC transporter permease [Geminicoccus roseus]|uniref:ABC transporter permease n=1 Tax=Geminicoccus roseus TaxID=404900 RepID=UPI00040270AD|nr:ABC transporter permease [Geminicoccus roseus]
MGFILTFLARRLAQGLLIVLVVSFAIFALVRLAPGDPARTILGGMASDEMVEATAKEMGLRDPILVQYGRYLAGLVQGDLGTSYIKTESGGAAMGNQDQTVSSRASVTSLILKALPYTLQLAGLALVIAFVISVPLGIAAGVHAGRWPDKFAIYASSVFVSLPNFWFAIVLALVVTAKLGWIPSIGYNGFAYTILPAIVIAVEMSPIFIRSLSVAVADTLRQTFVEVAAVRGLGPQRILYGHVLRNSAVPILNLFGVQVGALLGGVLIVEYIFDYPGIGLLTVQAVTQRDFPIIQGVAILSSVIFVVVNILVDLVAAQIDPRLES